MGVNGLWKLLSASGRNIQLRNLEGAVVAIDVSIWMIRIIHGMARIGAQTFQRGHIIGIMKRLLYLMENGIKPVFVFDGPAPDLKRKTLQNRQQQRNRSNMNLQKIAEKYVVSLLEKGIDLNNMVIDNDDKEIQDLINEGYDSNFENEDLSEPIDVEFQEIQEQKSNEILQLKYQYFIDHYGDILILPQIEFNQLPYLQKIQLINDLEDEIKYHQLTYIEKDEELQNIQQISNKMLNQYIKKACIKKQIQGVQQEAQKQIEAMKIQRILDQFDDENSKFLKDYLFNNDDLEFKLGQLGVDDIYIYLKDSNERKKLVDRIYGFKRQQKQRRLKDYQQENQHMSNIRQRIKRRYEEKSRETNEELQFYLREDSDHQQNEAYQTITEKYEIYDGCSLKNLLLDNLVSDGDLNEQAQINIQFQEPQLEIQPQKLQIFTKEEIIEREIQTSLSLEYQSESQFSSNINQNNLTSESDAQNELYTLDQFQDENVNVNINININECRDLNNLNIANNAIVEKEIANNPNQNCDVIIQEKQQPVFMNQNQSNQNSKSKTQNLDQEEKQIEQMFEMMNKDYDNEENISNDEMIQNIQKYMNLNNLDFGSLQTKFDEVKYLLQLFGVPWVEAPAESEAQCSYLQQNDLVDFVISDDSDSFLFGATKIIKGLFQAKTNVLEYYDSELIEEELGLNRNKLIHLALFLGSDYTEGIKGVGIVNAMEIVEAFNSVPALQRFAQWASKADILLDNPLDHYQNIDDKEKNYKELHKNFKKHWELPLKFPNEEVIDAYINPLIDNSKEKFQWARPALEEIKLFCSKTLEWDDQKINENVIKPLQRFLQNEYEQKRITDYFRPKMQQKLAIINSKRIQNAVDGLTRTDEEREVQRRSLQKKRSQAQLLLFQQKRKTSKKNSNQVNDLSQTNQFSQNLDINSFEDFKYKKKLKK